MNDDDLPASTKEVADGFATYLAKRFVGDKRFRSGLPEEAASLLEQSEIVLSHADLGLSMICIADHQGDRKKKFSFSQQQLVMVGRSCLKYTGTVNGAKMPVWIALYEIADRPPSSEDCSRLKALQKTMPGSSKVVITCFYLDTRNKTVWSSAAFNGLLRGRKWIERILHEPRKHDDEIFAPDAALPQQRRRPIATAALLALLIAMFVVEHMASLGGKASGLLGVDVGTLFALGGMNADAVLKSREWYRILSASLLHGDAFHLLFNGIALGLSGYVLESLLGRAWFINLFFLGAIGGSLMGLVVNPANMVSVGASGAVMGLLAAAIVATMRFPAGAVRTQIQIPLIQFLIPSLIPLATHRQGGRIDFAAHFGGAIAGLVAGYVLMKIWPKSEEQPRFKTGAKGLAAVSILCVSLSLFFVKDHYSAYAAEASFSAVDLLVDDSKIPKEVSAAKRDVETWGKDRPRDPRVHLYRALRLLDEGSVTAAEGELRAALGEREILDRAFGNKKLETGIRAVLCELLIQQGKRDEAKREAQPVCKADNGATPNELRTLGVCGD